MAERPTMFEYAGGAAAFTRLTEAFYKKVIADPLLAPVFVDFTEDHRKHVALWLGEVFGGPPAYSEAGGSHQSILTAHAGRRISVPQRDRWIELMLQTAREELPDDQLFQQRFASYIRWGAGIAQEVSQLEEAPTTEDPVPHWKWE
jgi:truncated hemoglobin YjbI